MRVLDLSLASALVVAISVLTWSVAAAPSLPAVDSPPRLVKTIREEGEPCTSGPRLTPAFLAAWARDYDNECVEIALDVRCDGDCQATLPGEHLVSVRVNTAMDDVRRELLPGSESTVGLLGRFTTEPAWSLDVSRVMTPWW
jgi:hypothetical protein